MPTTTFTPPLPLDDRLRAILNTVSILRMVLFSYSTPNDAIELREIGPEHFVIAETFSGGRSFRGGSPAVIAAIEAWVADKLREGEEVRRAPLRALASTVRIERRGGSPVVVVRRDGDDPSPLVLNTIETIGPTQVDADALRAKLLAIVMPDARTEDVEAVLREASARDDLVT